MFSLGMTFQLLNALLYIILWVSKEIFKFCYMVISGVVLFPQATLPLRVIESNVVVSIESVLTQGDEPNTFGVVGELSTKSAYNWSLHTILFSI